MTTVGDRTLLIEPNGYLGVTEEKALSTSAGTRWVSHFVNINGLIPSSGPRTRRSA
jgi:hypothetical protein